MAVKLAVQSTFSDKGTRKAKDSVTSLDKHAKASFKRIAGYITGAFAFTKVVGFVKSAIGAYFEQQKAVEGLRNALATTNEATDENMASLQKVASALQVVTRVGDETTLALMTVGKSMGISTDNLDEAATAAIVFNKRFGIDMNTAMRGLALAFQGNTQQLSRYIPELRGVTDAEQAYNMIMKTTTGLLREQAELGMTTAERAKAIQAAWGDLTEELGAFIMESGLAEDVMDTLLFAIEDIQEVGLAQWFEDTFPALDGFIDRVISAIKKIGGFKDAVVDAVNKIGGLKDLAIGIGLGPGGVAALGARFAEETIKEKMGVGEDGAETVAGEEQIPPEEFMGPVAPTDREAERARRRTERRLRREERRRQAEEELAALRGSLGRGTAGEEDSEKIGVSGGQRLGAGELFERAFGMQAQKKEPTGTAGDPLHIIMVNPEDIGTGLA